MDGCKSVLRGAKLRAHVFEFVDSLKRKTDEENAHSLSLTRKLQPISRSLLGMHYKEEGTCRGDYAL